MGNVSDSKSNFWYTLSTASIREKESILTVFHPTGPESYTKKKKTQKYFAFLPSFHILYGLPKAWRP